MEMIIGGAYQGKTEYARKQYPQLRWSDGGSVTEEELMNAQGVTGFQQYIRSELENGKDVSDLAEKIICKNPDIVLVSPSPSRIKRGRPASSNFFFASCAAPSVCLH